MGPLDEVDEILLARIDPGVPDDSQDSDDPPESREEFVFSRDPADAPPALQGRRRGLLVCAGELTCRDLLQHGQELELPLEGDSLRDAYARRAADALESPARAGPDR